MSCTLIDVAWLLTVLLTLKEQEKIEKYEDLKREVKGLKDCKEAVIVPIVIGALGTVVSKRFHLYLKKTGFEGSI